MASSIGAAFRSMWHTMTSNDRHYSVDYPYRAGTHAPMSNRNTLTSIATATDSRPDVTSPYSDERHSSSPPDPAAGFPTSPYTPTSPNRSRPYSPGLRSTSAQRSSQDAGPPEIQMQSFEDGVAPAPPVSHSWQRIDGWAEEHYPELFDQLCEGATSNDLNELEHILDCSLPQDVRESLMIHDGQERPGLPTGIIFGSMLLDCEEMVQEWENWRKVSREFLSQEATAAAAAKQQQPPSKPSSGGSTEASSSKSPPSSVAGGPSANWRQDLASRQDCVPAGAIKKVYTHPAWIPLVRDWGGNNLAVDLSPGPTGRWGQIIMFGRDYDTKYVVARSWAGFVAMVADDLNSGKWFVDEETNELKLREFKDTRVEPAYFSILRWRMDQKHGRRGPPNPKRRSFVGPASSIRPPAASPSSPASSRSVSPYASPVEPAATSPLPSATRLGFPKPSPLSRVAEEGATAAAAGKAAPPVHMPTPPEIITTGLKPTKLVEVDTPRVIDDGNVNALKLAGLTPPTPTEVAAEKEKESAAADIEEGMKTIQI